MFFLISYGFGLVQNKTFEDVALVCGKLQPIRHFSLLSGILENMINIYIKKKKIS